MNEIERSRMETIPVWRVIETRKTGESAIRKTIRVVPDEEKAQHIATARRIANRTKERTGRTVTVEEGALRVPVSMRMREGGPNDRR